MPVERHIREILEGGESSLLRKDMSRRLDMLVRQGLMPVSKLPLLKRGLEKLQLGKVGSPQEREQLVLLLNSMMFIVLGDDTVFNLFANIHRRIGINARRVRMSRSVRTKKISNLIRCMTQRPYKGYMQRPMLIMCEWTRWVTLTTNPK